MWQETRHKAVRIAQVSDAISQDGKPYIAYLSAGIAHDDPRSKGYTVVAQSSFYSLDDMKYYDEADASHQELKKTAREAGLSEPPLTVYVESTPVINLRN